MDETINNQLILAVGESASGKSASLRHIENQDRWLYLNAEAGKRLPFRNQFNEAIITDPMEVLDIFDAAMDEDNADGVDGIILDSLTFLMDMFETQYVIGSSNTMKAWGEYQQFFKRLMQEKVPQFGKPVVITAHTRTDHDEKAMEMKTSVPIKGALKNNGVEAYFSTVVASKKVSLKDLKKYHNPLLDITEEEEELGFKYVFQTRLTKTTTGERIRSPMGMFDRSQTYIDNDVWKLLHHLNRFYDGDNHS